MHSETIHREFHPEHFAPPRRLRHNGVSDTERNWAMLLHLSPFIGFFLQGMVPFAPLPILLPLFVWLYAKRESVFNDDHGREVVNFCISFVLLHIVLAVTIIGLLLWPVLWVVGIVNLIRGAIAAGNGEYFRYPVTIRLIR